MRKSLGRRGGSVISVVMTARDAESTVGEAVESVLGQTCRDFELVLVDNGSVDGMRDFVDGRVRVFKCGGTHVEAHQLGVAMAAGELIARMDADDVCHPERLARQVDLLESEPELDGCSCGVRVCARGGDAGEGMVRYVDWLNGLRTPEQVARERFIESPVVHPASMVRREALARIGGYREVPWAEDYDLWLRFFGAGMRMGVVAEVLFDWYDSETRLTRANERYSQENFLRAKAHYLAKLGRRFEICGAGPIGKRIGRLLLDEGAEVSAFFEVNPRRIGEVIAGVPVRDQATMSREEGVTLLGAVGLAGARDLIRALAADAGYVEGADFICVA